MTGGGLMHIDWGREQACGGSARGILKQKLNDVQLRETFTALHKQHTIPVIFEHRVSTVQREGTTIQSISLNHAPPDRLGCPYGVAKTRDARRIRHAYSSTPLTRATSWRVPV